MMPRKASLDKLCPSALFFIFFCVHHAHTNTRLHTDRHSQAVNGAPVWCSDCAGQCAPLCDCMPPRLRLSLDTSQPSRPADLYPTVTLSERHRETEGERANEREREGERTSEGIESEMGGGAEKWKAAIREQIERRGGNGGGTGDGALANVQTGEREWRGGREAGKWGSDAAMDNSEWVKRGKG